MNTWLRKYTMLLAVPVAATGLFLLAGCDSDTDSASHDTGEYHNSNNSDDASVHNRRERADESPTYTYVRKENPEQQSAQSEQGKPNDEKSENTSHNAQGTPSR